MAIDKIQGTAKPDKMLQIQSAQKVISNNIFHVSNEDKEKESLSMTTIHSGHFMVSRVHEEKDEDDDEEGPVFSDDTKDFSTSLGYDFVKATKETSQTYHFGPKSTSTLSIDASLTKLFECMTLAYSGKITSPKWKPFRGMHLTIKDKVRLNNIIWREWHMQYIFQMRPVICQFATPLSDYIHSKPEAVVLEGKYWKRRLDTVTKEYKRWRRYYRDRILQSVPEASLFSPFRERLTEMELLERVAQVSVMPHSVQQSSTDLTILNSELMDMDFTDNLFSSLNQPFAFPNPRELSQLTCADLIQPGLVQLQPNLEDFMDIDNLQELLAVSRPSSSATPAVFTPVSVPSPAVVPEMPSTIDLAQSQQLFQNTTSLGFLDPAIFSGGNSNNNMAGMNMLTALAALSSVASSSSGNAMGEAPASASTAAALNPSPLFTSDSQMLVDDGSSGKQTIPSTGQQGGFLGALLSAELGLKARAEQAPTLTLQTNPAPQNIFSGPSGVAAPQTVELQQILNPQQVFSSQQTMLAEPALGLQPTLGSTQSLSTAQTLGGTLTLGGTHTLGSQETLGLSQALGSRRTLSSQQPLGSQSTGGSPRGVGVQQGLSLAMAAAQPLPSPQRPSVQKVTVVSQQTATLQPMAAPQSVQTVNLTALGLSPSPSSLTPSSVATLSYLPVTMATDSTTVLSGAVSASPAKTVKGWAGAMGGQKTSPLQAALTSRPVIGQTAPAAKKDVFAVPQGKPVMTPRKPRTIAPAPSSPRSSAAASSTPSPSMQNTYLAQLLTKGTYPGALISVKKEPPPSSMVTLPTSNLSPVLPTLSPVLSSLPASTASPRQATSAPSLAPATLAFTATPVSSAAIKLPSEITMEFSKVSGVDFATSVLLAAASSAIGTTPSSLKDVLRLNPSSVATASIASEMSTTPAASPQPQSPMQVVLSPSPVPSATPPPISPLAAVFSEALSPLASPSSHGISFQQTSPSSLSPPQEDKEGGASRVGGVHIEQRRVAHLSAEQKRRGNLKTGFDLLHTLVPSIATNPKVSKATMLQKTAEHCRKMKAERAQMQHEASILRQEIESLNSAISNVQAQLPETGVPVTRQRVDHMKDMFDDYVRTRTIQNWKFWIFSIIIRSLFDSYNSTVSTASVEELCRTVASWLDQHCSLVSLRPTVLNALRHLSMTTSILTEPARVREQATEAVTKGRESQGGHSRDSSGHP